MIDRVETMRDCVAGCNGRGGGGSSYSRITRTICDNRVNEREKKHRSPDDTLCVPQQVQTLRQAEEAIVEERNVSEIYLNHMFIGDAEEGSAPVRKIA